jgi:hypothetical protein
LGRNERREVAEMTSSAAASSSQAGFRKQDGDPARRVAERPHLSGQRDDGATNDIRAYRRIGYASGGVNG